MTFWLNRFLAVLVLTVPSLASAQGVDAQLHGVIRTEPALSYREPWCQSAPLTPISSKSNTRTALEGSGGGPAAATNPCNVDEDYGPADHDVRHNLTVDGSAGLHNLTVDDSAGLPFDIMLSGILTAQSPLPFSATTTQQLDTDPFVDRPEPRSSRRGDRFVTLASKAVRRGRVAGTAFVEVFNLTNEMNFTQYTSAVTSTRFAQPSAACDRRRTQVGFRLDF